MPKRTIEKLTLLNFQTHQKLKIHLGQITTIIGQTDIGKSAIIRALRWVCLNRPSGGHFVKWGSPESSVTIELSNGSKITRTKGKENLYQLDDSVFKSFNREVPPEITTALPITELNFQKQLDGPFWFELTPAALSQELNKLVDLSSMDRALSWMARRVRKEKERVEVCQENVRASKTDIERLADADDMMLELEQIEKLNEKIKQLKSDSKALRYLINQVGNLRKRIVTQRSALKLARHRIESLRALRENRNHAKRTAAALKRTLSRIDQTRKRIKQIKLKIDAAERQKQELTKGRCPICGNDL